MSGHEGAFSRFGNRLLVLALGATLAVGALWVLYVILAASFNPSAPNSAGNSLEGFEKLKFAASPQPAPRSPFQDEAGKTLRLSDKAGRVLLVNLWATWCGPCIEEMPSLDRLQKAKGGDDFEVVAISMDRGGLETVRAFYGEHNIQHLALYNTPSMAMTRELLMDGLPISLLIARNGFEIARLAGPAEWDSPQAQALIQDYIDRR